MQYAEVTNGTEYASWCDLVADRYWAHLSRRSIETAHCDTNVLSKSFMLCECSEQSSAASRLHTGMQPIVLPGALWY